ncbi:MAG: protein-glutamate O-methyltransferase CheR [Leptospiraceae bacterium]|nr:protein-glutamate O-methyltransferase CheR [Leptospiraceae bacterium]
MSTIVAEKKILNNQKQDLYLYVSEFLHKNVGLELTRSRFELLEKEINTILDIALDFNPKFSVNASQLEDLIHIFSNHETSFYRHAEHFDILYNEIFPSFFGDNPDKPIRIWSAACSYGQEVYSIAILLEEFLDRELYLRARKLINTENIQAKHRNISITGTDISKNVIEFAQNGVYSLKELDRNLSKAYRILLDNYCIIKHDRLLVSNLIKSQVEFKVYNLLQSNFQEKFDIIFCRNVLIYFKPEVQSKVIQKMVENLNTGGYIFIGPSETIFGMEAELETIHSGHCVFYRKLGI